MNLLTYSLTIYQVFLDVNNFLVKFSFTLNLSSHFSEMAAPCYFKTCHMIIGKFI